jgi:hypothetical protein
VTAGCQLFRILFNVGLLVSAVTENGSYVMSCPSRQCNIDTIRPTAHTNMSYALTQLCSWNPQPIQATGKCIAQDRNSRYDPKSTSATTWSELPLLQQKTRGVHVQYCAGGSSKISGDFLRRNLCFPRLPACNNGSLFPHNKCTHDLLWYQTVWVAITTRTIRKNWVVYKILFMWLNFAHLQATMTHLYSYLKI